MKNLNITISILFIMFTANCMGMKALPPQNDSPKAEETIKNASKFGLSDPINLDSSNSMAPKEKIYTDDVAVPELLKLFEHIRLGKFADFKNLLIEYPELKLMKDSKGNNALIVAAYYGQNSFIEFLLDKSELYSMNIYNMNSEGEDAFTIACKQNNLDTVEYISNNLPDNFPNSRLIKYSLKDGLKILNKHLKMNLNSDQHIKIISLIKEKLSLVK